MAGANQTLVRASPSRFQKATTTSAHEHGSTAKICIPGQLFLHSARVKPCLSNLLPGCMAWRCLLSQIVRLSSLPKDRSGARVQRAITATFKLVDHPYLASCYYHLLDDNRFIPCSHDYWISAQTCLYIAEQGLGSNGRGSQAFTSLYPVPHTSGSIRPAPTLEKKLIVPPDHSISTAASLMSLESLRRFRTLF